MDNSRGRPDYGRRDYSQPAHRPHAPKPAAPPPPPPPAPAYNQPPQAPAPQPQPTYRDYSQPAPAYQQPAPSYAHPQAQPLPPQVKRRAGWQKPLIIVVGVVIAAAAGFGVFKILTKSKPQTGIPDSISKQVSFQLFYPSPLPAGYTYQADSATFQVGQVFYKFDSGTKRITVNEQPVPNPAPDLTKLSGFSKLDATVGQAVIGNEFGQAEAIIIDGSTIITMHTSGKVTTDELKTSIANLKYIGKNSDHQTTKD